MARSADFPAPERNATARIAIILAIVGAVAGFGFVASRIVPDITDGIWNFVIEGQREMTQGMTRAMQQLKTAGSVNAALVLGLISFLYGVLHAVGPGHGKFVISSYALASQRTVRRGILLSFMAAFIQALSAIVVVGVLSLVMKATSIQIKATENWLETISWGLIGLFGAWLLWRQLGHVSGHDHDSHAHDHASPAKPAGTHDHTQDHAHVHSHDHGHSHGHARDHQHAAGHVHGPACAHAHDAAHVHDEHCGHTHMALPEQLQGEWSWAHALSLAFSIGIRPCTGAIIVLISSIGLGIGWAGVFATFTMAIGTAITVSALAALAVGSRELAARIAGGVDSPWAASVQRAAGIGGAATVMILGLMFFIASLRGGPPL